MYKILLTFLFTFLSLTNYAQLTDRVTYLEGNIGSNPVKMILIKNVNPYSTSKNDKYIFSGYYYYHDKMFPIEIAQNLDDNLDPGITRIETVYDGENEIDVFDGKLTNSSFIGTWMTKEEELPFNLSVKKSPCVFAEYVTFEIVGHKDYDEIRAHFTNKFTVPTDTAYQKDIMRFLNNGNYIDVKEFQKRELENFKTTHSSDAQAFIKKYNGDYLYQLNYEKFQTIYPIIIDEKYMVLEHKNYTFFGGDHRKMEINYFNYDLTNKKRIQLSDIININHYPELTNLIESKLRLQYNIPDNEFLGEMSSSPFKVDKVPAPQDFMLVKNGIIIVYQPDSIAEYRFGSLKIFLTKAEIEKYLNSGFEFP